jgi:hypothetical protein
VLQIRMRSRKIVTARHCRRDPACVFPAIRDGWAQARVNKAAERNIGGLAATGRATPDRQLGAERNGGEEGGEDADAFTFRPGSSAFRPESQPSNINVSPPSRPHA